MIHWKTKQKIKTSLEAQKNAPIQKIVLNSRELAALQSYVKKHFKESPVISKSPSRSSIAGKSNSNTAYFSTTGNGQSVPLKQKRKKTFALFLLEKLDERDISIEDLCAWIGLPPSIVNKTKKNQEKVPWEPEKDIVIKMGMAMHMNKKQLGELLAIAGYTLTENSKTDLAIRHCLDKKIYNRWKIDACVFELTGKNFYSH